MGDLRRRGFMTAMATLPALGGKDRQADSPSLRACASKKNILFGTMVTLRDISDPNYARLVTDECAIITPGVEAKWPFTEPAEGVFRFGPLDTLADFAAASSLRLHMHNLIWSVFLPPWTIAALAQGRGLEIMHRHIATVAGRYRGRVHSWDVVNEPVNPDYPADRAGILTTPWWHSMGPDFIVDAFNETSIADPAVRMMVNDDDLEHDSAGCEKKRTIYLRLVEAWLRRGMKLNALGLEAHLKPWLPLAERPYRRFLQELAGMGLKLRITELDVNDRSLPPDIATRDRIVAAITKRFLDLVLDEPAVDTLIVWGLSDRATWMLRDPGGRRPDGLPPRPSPYDAHLAAKPMRAAIAASLAGARSRPL
jgi:endo-1,4-beta-xylanase